jgi:hypothetical protein
MKRRKIKRKQEKEVGEEEIIRVISPWYVFLLDIGNLPIKLYTIAPKPSFHCFLGLPLCSTFSSFVFDLQFLVHFSALAAIQLRKGLSVLSYSNSSFSPLTQSSTRLHCLENLNPQPLPLVHDLLPYFITEILFCFTQIYLYLQYMNESNEEGKIKKKAWKNMCTPV